MSSTAVKFAHDNDLRVAIRGGGHNGPGLGSVNDGLMIDLVADEGRACRSCQRAPCALAPAARRAMSIMPPMPMASPCRPASSRRTGIAGLTLGGGTGYLTRKYGLTIDNLLEADVVLADGPHRHGQRLGNIPISTGACAAAAAISAS